MSKFSSDNIVYRLNKYIEQSLRGQFELNGAVNSTYAVIPAASAYVTDPAEVDNFQLPFLFPAGQAPEVMTIYDGPTAKFHILPFGTYTWSQTQRTDQPWLKCGTATYVFYSPYSDKLDEIQSALTDLLGREDYSATDINYFYRADPTFEFEFTSINYSMTSGNIPSDNEGGRQSCMIVVNYDALHQGANRPTYQAQTKLGRI